MLQALVGVSQDGRRMKCSHHQYSALIYKLSVLEGNLEIRRNNTVCRNPAQTYNYFGTYQGNLFPQPGIRILLLGQGVSVVRRSAFYDVCNIYVMFRRARPPPAFYPIADLPARQGLAFKSSCSPGPSPINIISDCGLPVPTTTLLRVSPACSRCSSYIAL